MRAMHDFRLSRRDGGARPKPSFAWASSRAARYSVSIEAPQHEQPSFCSFSPQSTTLSVSCRMTSLSTQHGSSRMRVQLPGVSAAVGIRSFQGRETQSLVDAPGPVVAYRAAVVRTASSTT